ncbi:hypothetical protein Q5752_004903 [Cryptotrichosporon argae]
MAIGIKAPRKTPRKAAGAPAAKPAPKPAPKPKPMAKRKPAAKKANKVAKDDVDVADVPTLAALKKDPAFRQFGRFKLTDHDTIFCRGDYVFVLPPPPDDIYRGPDPFDGNDDRVAPTGEYYWVARICDIFGKNAEEVYLDVQWCFTDVLQLKETGCANPPAVLRGRELVISTFHDVIAVQSVSDKAHVMEYNESLPQHDDIDTDQPFYRSTLVRYTDMTAEQKASIGDPKGKARRPYIFPLNEPSCSCGQPYEPLPLGESSSMVYCRQKCQRWYHSACCSSKSATARLLLDVQRSAPDLPDHAFKSKGPLPPTHIVLAAQSALARGTEAAGIAGNGKRVLDARRLVAHYNAGTMSAFELGQEAARWGEQWYDDEEEEEEEEEEEGSEQRDEVYVCPGCGWAV